MNNNKMTRTAKNLDIFANVAGKITAGVGIACVVLALLTLILGEKMFTEGAVTLDLDFIKFHLRDDFQVREEYIKLYAFAASLGGGIVCFLISYISKLVREILTPMKLGRPFEDGISGNLKKIGWAVLVGGFLSEVIGMGARVLLMEAYSIQKLFTSDAIVNTEFVFTMNLNFVLAACVIFLLSYIFTYGQVLQQESDETL